MKIFKKNQVIIYVIALMLMTAGYLNYTTNNEKGNSLETSIQMESGDDTQLADIGDATLVNSNDLTSENETNLSTANIEVDDGIAVKYLKVDTFSGDVNVYATYTKASISTNEGNVDVSINAQSRVELQVLTVQGDIEIRLKNIRKVNFRAKSKFGEILNNYKGKYGYIASIKATTKNGNITVE